MFTNDTNGAIEILLYKKLSEHPVWFRTLRYLGKRRVLIDAGNRLNVTSRQVSHDDWLNSEVGAKRRNLSHVT